MTTNNHTPGPWASSSAPPGQYLIFPKNSGRSIATIATSGTAWADAALIAAAPELLEALEEIRLLTSRTIHPTDTRQGWEPVAVERLATIERKARAAIAKALGGGRSMTCTPKTDAIIAAHGLTMDAVLEEDGGRRKPSRWRVTIKKGLIEWTTTYHMGVAHRELPERLMPDAGTFPRRVTERDKAEFAKARFKATVTLHEERLLKISQPTPPTLSGVLWSLAVDAEQVRHGQSLSEFGRDLGYSDLQEGIDAYSGHLDEWRALVRFGLDLDELYDAVTSDDECEGSSDGR